MIVDRGKARRQHDENEQERKEVTLLDVHEMAATSKLR